MKEAKPKFITALRAAGSVEFPNNTTLSVTSTLLSVPQHDDQSYHESVV